MTCYVRLHKLSDTLEIPEKLEHSDFTHCMKSKGYIAFTHGPVHFSIDNPKAGLDAVDIKVLEEILSELDRYKVMSEAYFEASDSESAVFAKNYESIAITFDEVENANDFCITFDEEHYFCSVYFKNKIPVELDCGN